jgi:hypothetical protein
MLFSLSWTRKGLLSLMLLSLMLLGLVGLSACGSVSGLTGLMGPRTIEINRDQLMSKLGQQFPMKNQVLDVFEVTAMSPRLTLQPDNNRVLADLDIAAKDRLFEKSYQGSLWLSFGLRYEPRDQTIRLQQVTIDKVSLQGLPASYERYLTRLGAWLAEDRLQNFVVHRLSPDQLAQADKHGLTVSDVKITPKGLGVMLQPKP